jgi:hypothetical protein
VESGEKLWIITAADRSVTTRLFPEEYRFAPPGAVDALGEAVEATAGRIGARLTA